MPSFGKIGLVLSSQSHFSIPIHLKQAGELAVPDFFRLWGFSCVGGLGGDSGVGLAWGMAWPVPWLCIDIS